MIVVDTYQTKK